MQGNTVDLLHLLRRWLVVHLRLQYEIISLLLLRQGVNRGTGSWQMLSRPPLLRTGGLVPSPGDRARSAAYLLGKDLERLRGVAGSNDAVTHFNLEDLR